MCVIGVVCFAWPLIQSTTVLLSSLISNSNHLAVVGGSSTMGSNSLVFFFAGSASAFLLSCAVGCLNIFNSLVITPSFRGGCRLFFCIQSFPSPMEAISQNIEHFHEGQIPSRTPVSNLQRCTILVFMSGRSPQRFWLGLHVHVQQLFDDVVYHDHHSFLAVAE